MLCLSLWVSHRGPVGESALRLRHLVAQVLVRDLILQPFDARFEFLLNFRDQTPQLFENALDDFELAFVLLSILYE